MKPLFLRTIASVFLTLLPVYAQDTLVEIRNIYSQRLKMEGFALEQDQEIRIQATGVHFKKRREEMILGTTWILNSKTREVVWQFAAQVPGDERIGRADDGEGAGVRAEGAGRVGRRAGHDQRLDDVEGFGQIVDARLGPATAGDGEQHRPGGGSGAEREDEWRLAGGVGNRPELGGAAQGEGLGTRSVSLEPGRLRGGREQRHGQGASTD